MYFSTCIKMCYNLGYLLPPSPLYCASQILKSAVMERFPNCFDFLFMQTRHVQAVWHLRCFCRYKKWPCSLARHKHHWWQVRNNFFKIINVLLLHERVLSCTTNTISLHVRRRREHQRRHKRAPSRRSKVRKRFKKLLAPDQIIRLTVPVYKSKPRYARYWHSVRVSRNFGAGFVLRWKLLTNA